MRPLPSWLGISIALHVALGVGVWAAARTTGTSSSPTGGISAVAVMLVEASAVHCDEPCAPAPSPVRANSLRSPARPAATEVAQTQEATSPEPTPDVLQAEFLLVPSSDFGPSPSPQEPTETPGPLVPDASELPSPVDGGLTSPSDPPSSSVLRSEITTGDSDEHDRYRPMVLAILERAKRYPLFAQRRGFEGTVEIAFIIAQDGQLSEPELVASSRHDVLDRATLDMVRRVGTVPPPPDPGPLRFAARIQYTLDTETSSTSTKGASP